MGKVYRNISLLNIRFVLLINQVSMCQICFTQFDSHQQMVLHQFSKHKIKDSIRRYICDTHCPICLKEFHKRHVKRATLPQDLHIGVVLVHRWVQLLKVHLHVVKRNDTICERIDAMGLVVSLLDTPLGDPKWHRQALRQLAENVAGRKCGSQYSILRTVGNRFQNHTRSLKKKASNIYGLYP